MQRQNSAQVHGACLASFWEVTRAQQTGGHKEKNNNIGTFVCVRVFLRCFPDGFISTSGSVQRHTQGNGGNRQEENGTREGGKAWCAALSEREKG